MTSKKNPFVFGERPSHTHVVEDVTIVCNSPYCDHMDAHPLDQENQRAPWSKVSR